jgi:hypothetical protein
MKAPWQRAHRRYSRPVLVGVGITLLGTGLDLAHHVWLAPYEATFQFIATPGHLATGAGVMVAFASACLLRRGHQSPNQPQRSRPAG